MPASDIAEALESALEEAGLQPRPFVLEHLLHHLASAPASRSRVLDWERLLPAEDPCPIYFDGFSGPLARMLHDSESPITSTSSVDEEESLQEPVFSMRELRVLGPCSYLSPGQAFYGSQRMSSSLGRAAEDWEVVVRIQGVVPSNGYVCGVMEARNVPNEPRSQAPITTFWEGEIVDNVNHTFFTHKFGALRETDLSHWRKFPGFSQLAVQRDGRSTALETCGCVYMRWKETFFVDPSESCMLTIQGFYYVMMDRQTGSISGFYYDPNSTPYQRLSLRPFSGAQGSTTNTANGVSFASYSIK